jgi:hypothetical protein
VIKTLPALGRKKTAINEHTVKQHYTKSPGMSSRALRRAQKELEEKQILEKLAQEEQEDEEESEEEVVTKPKAKPSLFAMLGDGDDDQDDDEDDDGDAEEQPGPEPKQETDAPPATKSKKSKKKKKKGKSKAASADVVTSHSTGKASSGLDEIDQALMALDLTANGRTASESDQQNAAISEEVKQLCAVLSVDSQHLHAANEMKKLFGRAALQNTDDEPRQRQRGHGQQGGIAAAVAGRNAPGTRGLASLGLRRNIFVQGKEEWPRATSGGLAMEVVERRPDGTVEYRFVHNRTYQEVQQQFRVCVGSMDPERMIQLLHFNRKWSATMFILLRSYNYSIPHLHAPSSI